MTEKRLVDLFGEAISLPRGEREAFVRRVTDAAMKPSEMCCPYFPGAVHGEFSSKACSQFVHNLFLRRSDASTIILLDTEESVSER